MPEFILLDAKCILVTWFLRGMMVYSLICPSLGTDGKSVRAYCTDLLRKSKPFSGLTYQKYDRGICSYEFANCLRNLSRIV